MALLYHNRNVGKGPLLAVGGSFRWSRRLRPRCSATHPSCAWGLLILAGLAVLFFGPALPDPSVPGIGDGLSIVAVILIIVGVAFLFIKPSTKHWDETTGAELRRLDEPIARQTAELEHAKDVVAS